MAVAMQQLEIAVPIWSSKDPWNPVINFHLISLFEVEMAPSTFPLLSLEEIRHLWRRLGMCALPFCPIKPVAVERTFPGLHLHMALDWRHAMEAQGLLFGRKSPSALFWMPIRAGSPCS